MTFSVNGITAIIPVKRFAVAKQRLACVLSPDERARLAEAMLSDVLTALRPLPQLTDIVLVTAESAAAEIGRGFCARTVADQLEAGVNIAVLQGLDSLRPAGGPVAVIAADVPFATSDDITAAFALLRHDPIVLAPAETDAGTNLLAMRRAGMIEPSFGERSFVQHRDLAHAAKLSCGICRPGGLRHDIDRPSDLIVPVGSAATRTGALLQRFNIATRLGGQVEPPQPILH